MDAFEANPWLLHFEAERHEKDIRQFQRQDYQLLDDNRRNIIASLCARRTEDGDPARLLARESAKQRRHLPIRALVERAGRSMQELCPCWMMTPLAVAQFLPPGAVEFDLVIMDEASQIRPEDAWGAITRGTQVVVVGDQKQMPPSDFFSASVEDEADQDPTLADENGARSESILDAASATLATRMMKWHYRSRHESLIAPANLFSYENRLILFPSALHGSPDLGIRHFRCKGTVTSSPVVNREEARQVVQRLRDILVEQHRKPGDRRSIGVVTMNHSQMEEIEDLLAEARASDATLDAILTEAESSENVEPLIVRNLENIQGDERDILLISCTYGPNEPGGRVPQRFGPLTLEGGERRFNVLITRAKWRMEVFASLDSTDIETTGKRRGVQDFHDFLLYAEKAKLPHGQATGRPSEPTAFELCVESTLQRCGYKTSRRVGLAGYFVDLAVHHPKRPEAFAIGIEFDGSMYHSSPVARDRDRLRRKVLLSRHWTLHRVWAAHWFRNPSEARRDLLDAVKAACA
jgi:superfamily I DNA and/or RNA helicase/very-short-patch-repair endonuclease